MDGAWPLVGEAAITTSPTLPGSAGDPGDGAVAQALAARDGQYGLLAEKLVLDRLGLHPGDGVRLGNAAFTVRGELLAEPDRVAAPLILGPRVLIAAAALQSTGLIAPGSMVQYAVRATLPDQAVTPALLTELRAAFPDQGWRIREPRDAAPGVTRFIDQTSLFMTLVGLTSLLVGGIGVANGVRAWLEARARTHRDAALPRRLRAAGVRGLHHPGAWRSPRCGVLFGLALGAALPSLLAAWLQRRCCRCRPCSGSIPDR